MKQSLLMLFCVVFATVAHASDAQNKLNVKVQQWIKELDADSYKTRRAASKKLREAGKAAFPSLVEAAKNGGPEVRTRAIHILKEHFDQIGSSETKTAAKKALEKISQGDNKIAANQAKEALAPPVKPVQRRVRRGLPLRIAGGRAIPFQIPRGIRPKRMSITINRNGQRTRFRFDGDKITIEANVNGKKKVYSAKNLNELKKKHPDAYKIYEKHKRTIDRIRNRPIGRPRIARPRGLPQRPVPAPGQRIARRNNRNLPLNIQKRILESRKRSLDNINKSIERLKNLKNPNFQRNIDALERVKKRFQKTYDQAKKKYDEAVKREQAQQKKKAAPPKPAVKKT